MNRLGLNLTSHTQNLQQVVDDIVDETPVIPEVGLTGPGGGTIFYTETSGNTITCYEGYIPPTQAFNQFIQPGNTYDDLIITVNNVLSIIYPSSFFADGETPGLTYTSNNELFRVADVTNTFAKEVIGYDSSTQRVNYEQGWFAEFSSLFPKNQSYGILYKELNVDSEESAMVVNLTFETDNLILSLDPATTIMTGMATNPAAIALNFIIYRKFIVEVPSTVALMPAYPATPTILPSEFLLPVNFNDPDNILNEQIDFAATYNGLTNQTLPLVVDRYRTNQQVLDAVPTPERNKLRSNVIVPGDDTRQITFTEVNRQIIAKVVYLLGTKPPNPWYDFATDELLYLEGSVLCFKTQRNTQSLLQALASLDVNKIKVPETRYAGQRLTQIREVNGQQLYYGEIVFKIDLDNIKVYEYIDGANIEKTVGELLYDGTANTYQAMLFEIKNLKITSNKRAGSTGRIQYLQTGIMAVPTYPDILFAAGADISNTFFSSPDTVFNQSLKAGTPLLDSSKVGYDFKAITDDTQTAIISTYAAYQAWAPLNKLVTRYGALTSNYETVNLSTSTVNLDIEVSIGFGIPILNAPVTIQHKIVVTDENDVATETVLSTLTLDSSNAGIALLTSSTSNVAIPAGGKLEVLFYIDSTSTTQSLYVSNGSFYEGDIYTGGAAPPPANPNTIVRTKYNYV